jgi:hypothetical protein
VHLKPVHFDASRVLPSNSSDHTSEKSSKLIIAGFSGGGIITGSAGFTGAGVKIPAIKSQIDWKNATIALIISLNDIILTLYFRKD